MQIPRGARGGMVTAKIGSCIRCFWLRKYINASDIFLHCLNAEDQFGTESPETHTDVLTITHSSKPGQTVGTGGEIYLFCYNQP